MHIVTTIIVLIVVFTDKRLAHDFFKIVGLVMLGQVAISQIFFL